MQAGLAPFVLVLTLGVLLGTVRTLFALNMPGDGRLIGALSELPIMLAASWVPPSFVIRRFSVPPSARARSLMGGVGFALQILPEKRVGVLLFGRMPTAHVARYRKATMRLTWPLRSDLRSCPCCARISGGHPRFRATLQS